MGTKAELSEIVAAVEKYIAFGEHCNIVNIKAWRRRPRALISQRIN